MNFSKRAFIIVLDSFGCGELDDARDYGDVGAHTFQSIVRACPSLKLPHLASLGLSSATHVPGFSGDLRAGTHAFARLRELSSGKDTITGHWELMGLTLDKPFPLFPEGFPAPVIEALETYTGRPVVGNIPASGTEIIQKWGPLQRETGALIVYTSGDSVLQIAAHEEVVPLEELYDICTYMRNEVLFDEYAVGRVIARPFVGNCEEGFTRTSHRHDFGIKPLGKTILDVLARKGQSVVGVGKINDIFSGCGITATHATSSNAHGMEITAQLARTQQEGLIFTNLVDFDMLWGHRRDVLGYARGLEEFDAWLGDFLPLLQSDDLLVITADHGCDPAFKGSDHTREYVPALWFTPREDAYIALMSKSFDCVGKSVLDWLK